MTAIASSTTRPLQQHSRPTRDCSLKRIAVLLFGAAVAITTGMFAATPIAERRCVLWNNEMHPVESEVIQIGLNSCPNEYPIQTLAPHAKVVVARRFLDPRYVWAAFRNCVTQGEPVSATEAALKKYQTAHDQYQEQMAQKPFLCERNPQWS